MITVNATTTQFYAPATPTLSLCIDQGIDIRTSGSHSIIELQGNRLNGPRNILIGEHTWVGAHVSILKGAEIAGDSVVATRSVVTRRFTERNLVICGSPAAILRREISWRHERLPMTPPIAGSPTEIPLSPGRTN